MFVSFFVTYTASRVAPAPGELTSHLLSATWVSQVPLPMTTYGSNQDTMIKANYVDTTYDYIIVHVDDFMILAKDAESYMAKLQKLYNIRHVTPITESSTAYLGMDIRRMPHGKRGFLLSAHTYLTQALSMARTLFDYDTQDDLKGRNTVLDDHKHYDDDSSDLLNEQFHKKYLQLVGMLNWVSALGRVDITYATRKLARYSSLGSCKTCIWVSQETPQVGTTS